MSELFQQPPLPLTIRPLKNEESTRLKAKYPSLSPDPLRKCITCHDRRTYRWYAPDRSAVVEYECNCVDQWLLNRSLLSSNIGVTYQRLGWGDMEAAERGAVEKAHTYLEHSESYVPVGFGLIFYGNRGTGKTALSSLLLKGLIEKGHDAYFTTFSEMIDTYTGGWNDKDERSWFHKRIKNAGVLVLDDIGKEYQGRAKSGLPESTFDEVLRHRVAASTPTIITTNQTMDEMRNGYGSGVMSLLQERATTYEFRGEDFRTGDHRNRLADEIEAGLSRPVVLR